MSEIEVDKKDDNFGGFDCPKCGKHLSPEDEEGYEMLRTEGACHASGADLDSVTIKCSCGQVIKVCLK